MKNLSMRARIALCLASNLALLAAAGGTAIYLISEEEASARKVSTSAAEAMDTQSRLTEVKEKLASSAGELLLAVYAKDSSLATKARGEFAGALSELRQNLDKIGGLRDSQTATRARNLVQLSEDLAARVREMEQSATTVGPDRALAAWKDNVLPQADRLDQGIHDLVLQSRSDLTRWAEESTSTGTGRWLLTLILAAGLVSAAVGWLMNAQSTNSLSKLAWEIRDGAEQVAGAAGQVAGASQSLAQGAAEQAASLEETSASSEQLTSMTRKNSDNAQNAAGLADQSQKKVEQANQTLEQMVSSMNEITSSSGKISKIIKVIDEIAFQTNILALNAAVEAARAGEAGMGFAVVADEVRSLAQRCAQAAKDTASLIEESIQKSTSGSEHLSHVVAAVSSITQSAAEIKTLAQEVNIGSQEQSRGIDQISKAISQMEAVTHRTAANAEEGAAASEELSAQADSLRAFSASLLAIIGGAQNGALITVGPKAAKSTLDAPTKSLAALDKAVARHNPPVADAPGAASLGPISVRKTEQEFPLDNDFREF